MTQIWHASTGFILLNQSNKNRHDLQSFALLFVHMQQCIDDNCILTLNWMYWLVQMMVVNSMQIEDCFKM